MANKLLIVEDDLGLQKQLKWCFEDYDLVFASNRKEAIDQVKKHNPAVVLQDLGLPPDEAGVSEGFECLEEILQVSPFIKVIVVTGNHDRESALMAIGSGAYDFYHKPVDVDVLKLLVERAFNIHQLEEQVRTLKVSQTNSQVDGVIVTDSGMQKVCEMVKKVALSKASVLITGESGTGKELIARAVHAYGDHSQGRFVAINCAAIPEQLLEAELFGHEKGAFTGAIKQTIGKVELADGGTLFLDEIGDMPLLLQAKLLRFLQNRVIERIGGRVEIPVNTRVVCATNRNLKQFIDEQKFREDLYYRISEVNIAIPPLRERPGGATVIAHSILHKLISENPKDRKRFSNEAINALESYSWPGNVRELENKVRTSYLMADGAVISAKDLSLSGGEVSMISLKEVRSMAEKGAIERALLICENNVSKAAAILDVSRPTFYDLVDKYQIKI